MKLRFLIFSILLLAILPAHSFAKEIAYIDISSPDARKINIAIPWFVNNEQPERLQTLGRNLADTLTKLFPFMVYLA